MNQLRWAFNMLWHHYNYRLSACLSSPLFTVTCSDYTQPWTQVLWLESHLFASWCLCFVVFCVSVSVYFNVDRGPFTCNHCVETGELTFWFGTPKTAELISSGRIRFKKNKNPTIDLSHPHLDSLSAKLSALTSMAKCNALWIPR